MTDHATNRRIQRQRERKAVKTADKAICRAYNRAGMEGVEGIVDAIGAGTVEHWNGEQDDE